MPAPHRSRSLSLSIAILLAGSGTSFPAEISGAAGSRKNALKPENRVPEPHLAAASDEPLKVMKKFQLPAGTTTEVWAAEPMLGNAVAFSIDEQGRVFTSETYRYRTSVLDIRHYMFMLEDDLAARTTDDRIAFTKKNFPNDWQDLEKQTEVIRVIEDTKGAGRADSSRVYADGFNTMLDGIASGVLAHYGQVWFTNIPNLWHFSGMKPDGRAEKRESLSFGYGVRFSFTGHDMHGLAIGPDGRLYFSFGDRGAYVKTKEGRTLEFSDEGGVFRCELDGSHLEPVYRGLRNPQELAFDDHGNLFTGDNDCDQGDRERWVYIVEGGDSGWRVGWQHPPLGTKRNMWLNEKLWQPRQEGTPFYVLSPILNIPDGPSGVVHYPGTGLPAEYADAFFVCGFKGSSARSGISWWKVKEDGAGFTTEKSPATFIGSVQATDVDFGPDSRMYFSEWGEGWEGTGRGRIFRLEHTAERQAQAPAIAEVQRLLKDGFADRPVAELVKLLGHRDQRIRLNAQWALAAKEGQKGALVDAAKSAAEPLARLHAIWALGHIARLEEYKRAGDSEITLTPITNLLADKDPEVRAQTAKVLGEGRVTLAFPRLVAALEDASPRVRFFATMAVAKSSPKLAEPAANDILAMLRRNADRDQFLRHSGVMALRNLGESVIANAARDESASVRVAALLARRHARSAAVAEFLGDQDPALVKEAARAINDEAISEAYPALAKLIEKPMADENLALRVINANLRAGTAAGAAALAKYAADESTVEPLRLEALKQLGMWAKPPQRDRVAGVFRPLGERDPKPAIEAIASALPGLLKSSSVEVQMAAIEAAGSLNAAGTIEQLREVLSRRYAPSRLRIKALDTLALLDDPKIAEAIKLGLTDRDASLRVEASAILGKLDPDEGAKQLAAAFKDASVEDQKTILGALGDSKSKAADAAIEGLLGNLKAGQIPGEVQVELLDAAEKRKSAGVKDRIAMYEGSLPAGDKLAKYLPMLQGGDRENGERLFKEHAVAQCLRCHKVGDSGGDAGPALTGIASKKDRRYLLESIVDPNAQIAEGFQTIMVTTKSGDIQAGIVKAETADELTLQMPAPDAAPVKVKKAEIKSRENAPSGMPPGFGEILSRRDLRDILEYIASLK